MSSIDKTTFWRRIRFLIEHRPTFLPRRSLKQIDNDRVRKRAAALQLQRQKDDDLRTP